MQIKVVTNAGQLLSKLFVRYYHFHVTLMECRIGNKITEDDKRIRKNMNWHTFIRRKKKDS